MAKMGLALSGGGIKGAAHIGVLKALEENNIKIDYISGTSSGSIVACLYACGYSTDEIYDLFKKYCKIIVSYNINTILSSIRYFILKRKVPFGFINGEKIEHIMNKACNAKGIYNINQVKMPLAIQSVNAIDGTLVTFVSQIPRAYVDEKNEYINDIVIGKAVRASSSYPVLFNTCKFLDYDLIDGGVRDNNPIEVLYDMGADKTIVSCFESREDNNAPDDLFEVVFRCIDIMGFEISTEKLKKADYILKTQINNTKLLDISKLDTCYELGYESAINQIKMMKLK